jgi:Domain of unknown function (DUF1707)
MDTAASDFPSGDLRVSDADRDRALAELSKAFQVGRITADEFDQRSGLALRARTGKELIALLADLPRDHPPATPAAPAIPATAARSPQRVFAIRRAIGVSAVAATAFAALATANALIQGPSVQQQEELRQAMASHGFPVPPGPVVSPGFDWAGTVTPAVFAVLLIVLIIFLRTRLSRAERDRKRRTDS